MNRRGFFGALLAAPLVPKAVPDVNVNAPTQVPTWLHSGVVVPVTLDGRVVAEAVLRNLPDVLRRHGV